MGWNTSILLAEGKSLDDLTRVIPDVFFVTKKTVGWEEATTSAMTAKIALAEKSGWGILCTVSIPQAFEDEMLEIASRDGRALLLVFAGTDSHYGFCVYVKGKLKRRLFRKNFEVIEDEGKPLKEERALDWQDDEDAIFMLARQITGIDISHSETWDGTRFAVAEMDYP